MPPVTTDSPKAERSPFGRGMTLGSVFGFKVQLDVSLLIVFGLVAFNLAVGALPAWHPEWTLALRWGVALGAAVLFFVSILLHELAHAIVGRSLGIPIRGITLFMFGGMAQMEREPTKASHEFWMTIVGPITSLVLGVAATGFGTWFGTREAAVLVERPEAILREMGPLATLLVWLGPINIGLGLFNLLPGFPLDGGRVLRAAIWWATGDLRRATHLAAGAGVALSWVLICIGILMAFGMPVPFLGSGIGSGLWLVLIGWFLGAAARASYTQVVAKQALQHVVVGDLMWTKPEVVGPNDSVQELVRQKMLHSDQQLFPVVSNDDLVGAVSVNDLRRLPDTAWSTTSVSAIMTPRENLEAVTPSTDATQALRLLSNNRHEELPVVQGTHLEGLVRRRDLLRWLSLHVDGHPPS